MRSSCTTLVALASAALLACAGAPGEAPEAPDAAAPRNPALASGLCALVHCDPYQSDAFPVRGPARPPGALGDAELDLLWGSPLSAGVLDMTYPDGTTVFWVAKVDRIWKLGLDAGLRLVVLAELPLPPGKYPAHSADFMRGFVDELDALPFAGDAWRQKAAYWRDYQLEALHAYQAVLDRDGVIIRLTSSAASERRLASKRASVSSS